ncbi:hypothetical protein NA57DRAFT_77354 [Rhizodiscina lignyota]|uniref:Uncharacterized protein n=1 Tax=Rhizodiscina lignyota TaxID=1504668 RepID=A0A9P4IDN5_9PEZI|nr:hypothetical protein NA57DRAFT_77354 [Rhizodiscina lignyota]
MPKLKATAPLDKLAWREGRVRLSLVAAETTFNFQTASPLSKIPAEVRVKIYEYALSSYDIFVHPTYTGHSAYAVCDKNTAEVAYTNFRAGSVEDAGRLGWLPKHLEAAKCTFSEDPFRTGYDGNITLQPHSDPPCVSLLEVCRAVCDEASVIFWSNNSFTFNNLKLFHNFVCSTPSYELQSVRLLMDLRIVNDIKLWKKLCLALMKKLNRVRTLNVVLSCPKYLGRTIQKLGLDLDDLRSRGVIRRDLDDAFALSLPAGCSKHKKLSACIVLEVQSFPPDLELWDDSELMHNDHGVNLLNKWEIKEQLDLAGWVEATMKAAWK